MMRSSSFISYKPGTRPGRGSVQKAAKGVTDYLRANDQMAALLPAVTRMAALQQDCKAILPAVFDVCSVVQFESGQLVFSVPNSALASKLKQQLPKMQEALIQRGWQVNAIRLKLQVRKISEKTRPPKTLDLPPKAVSAFASLGEALDDSPQNQALKAAVLAMVNRHRAGR